MKHIESSLSTFDGHELFVQKWLPDHIKAYVIIVHGLGEHSGRYSEFAAKLVENELGVIAFDGRGHGKTAKKLPDAYIENYELYIKDVDFVVTGIKLEFPQVPIFLLGHSMGGGMVSAYMLHNFPKVNGVVLSSALLAPSTNVSKVLIFLSGFLSYLTPKIKTIKIDNTKLSHDQEVIKDYQMDPLVYHQGLPARTGYELVRMMNFIQINAQKFTTSVLMIHGTSDSLTPVEGTKGFFNKIGSEDKICKLYPGLYHELLNETSKVEITQEVIDWIMNRL
jgi:alpha-beta hydrolase superfamily lysophospholipase